MENPGCQTTPSEQVTPAVRAAPLVSGTTPPEAEIGRPEVVTLPEPSRTVLRSQSREYRSRVIVSAEIHVESSEGAPRPEPEVARRKEKSPRSEIRRSVVSLQ